jgi:hypothetical protein
MVLTLGRAGTAAVLSLPGVLLASSASTSAAGPARPLTKPPSYLFGSPSGNILCAAGPTIESRSTLVYCQERGVNPYRDVFLGIGGRVREGNGGGDPGDSIIRTIPYGHSISWTGVRCTSLKAGMRCVRTRTGHGFLINLAGVHRV